jgi:hypothetical protein
MCADLLLTSLVVPVLSFTSLYNLQLVSYFTLFFLLLSKVAIGPERKTPAP